MPPSKGLGGDEVQLGGDCWVLTPPPQRGASFHGPSLSCGVSGSWAPLPEEGEKLVCRVAWAWGWWGGSWGGGDFAGDAPPRPLSELRGGISREMPSFPMPKLDPCGGGHADWSWGAHPSYPTISVVCFVFFPVSSKRFSAKVSRSVMDPCLWGLHLCPTGLAEAGEVGGKGWANAFQGAFSHWFPNPHPRPAAGLLGDQGLPCQALGPRPSVCTLSLPGHSPPWEVTGDPRVLGVVMRGLDGLNSQVSHLIYF